MFFRKTALLGCFFALLSTTASWATGSTPLLGTELKHLFALTSIDSAVVSVKFSSSSELEEAVPLTKGLGLRELDRRNGDTLVLSGLVFRLRKVFYLDGIQAVKYYGDVDTNMIELPTRKGLAEAVENFVNTKHNSVLLGEPVRILTAETGSQDSKDTRFEFYVKTIPNIQTPKQNPGARPSSTESLDCAARILDARTLGVSMVYSAEKGWSVVRTLFVGARNSFTGRPSGATNKSFR